MRRTDERNTPVLLCLTLKSHTTTHLPLAWLDLAVGHILKWKWGEGLMVARCHGNIQLCSKQRELHAC